PGLRRHSPRPLRVRLAARAGRRAEGALRLPAPDAVPRPATAGGAMSGLVAPQTYLGQPSRCACLRASAHPELRALRLARRPALRRGPHRSEEHTSELQSRFDLVCRLLLEKKKCAAHPSLYN